MEGVKGKGVCIVHCGGVGGIKEERCGGCGGDLVREGRDWGRERRRKAKVGGGWGVGGVLRGEDDGCLVRYVVARVREPEGEAPGA